MGAITIVKEIKTIHPNYIIIIKSGGFYRVYGKDAYILSNLFRYKLKEEKQIFACGFPLKAINKVRAKLENKKINYIVLDSKDNYSINNKIDFKNLNNYEIEYKNSKVYVNNQIRIEKINEFLIDNASKENLKQILIEIEKIINAKGKIQSN